MNLSTPFQMVFQTRYCDNTSKDKKLQNARKKSFTFTGFLLITLQLPMQMTVTSGS